MLILPKRCKNRAESVLSCHHSHASVLLARLLLPRLPSAVTALHVALRPLETAFANCVPHGDFFCFFVPLSPAIFARGSSSIYPLYRRYSAIVTISHRLGRHVRFRLHSGIGGSDVSALKCLLGCASLTLTSSAVSSLTSAPLRAFSRMNATYCA